MSAPQIETCPAGHVIGENRQDMRRDRDYPLSRIGFRLSIESRSVVLQQFSATAAHSDCACHEVNVLASKGDYLAAS